MQRKFNLWKKGCGRSCMPAFHMSGGAEEKNRKWWFFQRGRNTLLKSRIKEFGTEEDKKFLKGFQVQSRKPAQRTRKLKQAPLYPLRQETTNKRQRTKMFSTLAGLSPCSRRPRK